MSGTRREVPIRAAEFVADALALSLHHLNLPQLRADLFDCQFFSRHRPFPPQAMFSHSA